MIYINAGYGKGYSVKEVLDAMKKVSGVNFNTIDSQRREGDPEALIADNTRIKVKMNWKPKYDNIELIYYSSYKWEKI